MKLIHFLCCEIMRKKNETKKIIFLYTVKLNFFSWIEKWKLMKVFIIRNSVNAAIWKFHAIDIGAKSASR